MSFKQSKREAVTNSTMTASSRNTGLATASLYSGAADTTDPDAYTVCTDGRYLIYDEYIDENYSVIDDLKNIKVDATQINLAQESCSQYIPFKLKRYWDGIDLMKMYFQFRYENESKKGQLANAVNVAYNDEYIVMGWLVDVNVTALAGTITFEIMATGTNEKGNSYVWRTKPNGKLTVLEALNYDGIIEPSTDWYTSFVNMVMAHVEEAKQYAEAARSSADSIDTDMLQSSVIEVLTPKITSQVTAALADYYDKSAVDLLLEDTIEFLNLTYDNITGGLVFQYQNKILSSFTINSLSNLKVKYAVINGKGQLSFFDGDTELSTVEIGNVEPSAEWTAAFRETIQEDIHTAAGAVQTSVDALKTQVDGLNVAEMTAGLETAKKDITGLKRDVENAGTIISETKNATDVLSKQVTSNTSAIQDVNTGLAALEDTVKDLGSITSNEYEASYQDNIFTLLENGEVKNQFTITGGSGGGTATSTITIERITTDNLIVLAGDTAVIQYKFTSVDNAGDTTGNGKATWRVGNNTVAASTAVQGKNSFDITQYLTTGTNTVHLSVTDSFGSTSVKIWSVTVVEFKLESSFDDKLFYSGETAFRYTPYGSISKQVIFLLDGKELGREITSVSGRQMAYTIPAQTHGAHLLEVYMTATINEQEICSNPVYKDIMWIDAENMTPVIGCSMSSFTVKQYSPAAIQYVVYDPQNNPAAVTLSEDGKIVSTLTLDRTVQTWSYKSSAVGTHTLAIACGAVTKTLNVTVTELGIDISPVTAGLAFDFNPSGKNNSDPEWLKINDTMSISVSDNFDKINGGYQIDSDGDTYFCVKAGTAAAIPYQLFADDARKNGKEFKLIFKTENIRKADTAFLNCQNGTTSKIGLQMNSQCAYVNSSNGSLYIPYSEEDIIEFEFNINKDSDIPMAVSFEDGVMSRPMLYDSDSSFTQIDPQPITIGSEDCDVLIYRMKAYSNSLSDTEILSNFIADAKNADEMISRYTRNQIYDENNQLTPEVLAEKAPQLRIIKVDCPHFTNNKKDKVLNTNIEFLYKNGDPVLDNWKLTDGGHSGQGTTSNEYGAAGRNLDLIMNYNGTDDNPDYISRFTFGDGSTGDKIALTRTSVPVNYLNVKVNIASSENQDNRLLQKRYHDYNPYIRPIRKTDPKVKDTMEFYNCAVFVRENDPDLTTHREFQDCDWHFYAIGNVGDSKKTDNTRVDDPADPKECILEIMDNTLPNSTFSGTEEALAALDADNFDEEGTYGWRYEMKGITGEQREENNQAWRDFYRFVSTSTDDEFKAKLKDYFVVDSALYFYLITEYFTMIDNRAKNTFWHRGKCEDGIYRWDLCFDYDNDTALGINNTGELTLTYGQEDIDYRVKDDPSSGYVFNAATSTFFMRIRNLFQAELRDMYVNRESAGCWSASNVINTFDAAQEEFPEELWRLDIERKYIRSYNEGSPRFLRSMMQGRKKYQRRQFMRNQEKYMATKYFGNVAVADQIMFRCNTPIDAVVTPDYTLHLTPYSNMYLSVMFGASYRTQIRAEAGVQYDIECPYATMDDTTVLVYCASFIQSMGDVSACYIHDNDFSKAGKLQELIIGSKTEGYQNIFLSNLILGNNSLLEKLDIRNTPNLTQVLNVSQCHNLEELYAEGSGITGVIFANRGKIAVSHLPAITSMTAKNLYNLSDFIISGYENITTLVIENCSTIDVLDMLEKAANLNRLRLIGVDWDLGSTDLLDRLSAIAGIDENGYNVTTAVLSGNVHVPIMREQKLSLYTSIWPDLDIAYDTMVTQYKVSFVNADADHTILDIQYVDKGAKAVDPVTRETNPIPVPALPSTISTDYTFVSWDEPFGAVFGDTVITAVYKETIRTYTVQYKSKGTVLQETKALYGSTEEYTGDIPVYTAEESAYKYHLFTGWDASGYVNGDKVINAVFDTCEYTAGCFDGKDLSQLSEVELYTMMKLGLETDLLSVKDSLEFKFGNDYSFGDVEEIEVIASSMKFDGTNYYDSGIKVMDKDREFTLALDFEYDTGNVTNSTLAQCYQYDGGNGFRLWYSTEPRLSWGTDSVRPANLNSREIIVIRHNAGSEKITVYNSHLTGDDITITDLTAIRNPIVNSTLVFGAAKADDGAYENFGAGTVHWCKVWYADLGDTTCQKIAQWPHESLTMSLAKFKSYYLADTASKRSSMTFLADNLLGVSKAFSNKSTNEGGWAAATLNDWLNTRLYKALSPTWKMLIKPVKVYSSAGLKSNDVSSSNCYFYVPSLYELESTATTDPYINETNAPVAYMINSDERKRAKAADPEAYTTYWTRSPNIAYSNYIWSIDENGNSSGYSYPSYENGVLLMFSIGV